MSRWTTTDTCACIVSGREPALGSRCQRTVALGLPAPYTAPTQQRIPTRRRRGGDSGVRRASRRSAACVLPARGRPFSRLSARAQQPLEAIRLDPDRERAIPRERDLPRGSPLYLPDELHVRPRHLTAGLPLPLREVMGQVSRVDQRLLRHLRATRHLEHHVRAGHAALVEPHVVRTRDPKRERVVSLGALTYEDPRLAVTEEFVVGLGARRSAAPRRAQQLGVFEQGRVVPRLDLGDQTRDLPLFGFELAEPATRVLAAAEQSAVLVEVPVGLLFRRARRIELDLHAFWAVLGVTGERHGSGAALDSMEVLTHQLAQLAMPL